MVAKDLQDVRTENARAGGSEMNAKYNGIWCAYGDASVSCEKCNYKKACAEINGVEKRKGGKK
jgi:hypothetical protein